MKMVSLAKASIIADMSVDTLRRAIKSGQLKAYKTSKNGHYRVDVDDLTEYLSIKDND